MTFGERRIKVVGVGGTLREGSASLGALRRALAAAGEAGAETELLEYGRRLDSLGEQVVDLAARLEAREERTELAGVAG